MEKVVIFADDRERNGRVIENLQSLPEVDLVVTRLEVGDYAVAGSPVVVFERKTVVDFARSIVDGRLFGQAQRLAASGGPASFIVEGTASDLQGIRVRREAIQGAMITLSIIFEIPVLRSLAPDETARLLLYAAAQTRRQSTGTWIRHGRRPRGRRRLQLHILQGLPGVGPRRAERLLEAFGSVSAVMTATRESLGALPGFGDKTASRIEDVLREEPTPYVAGDVSAASRQPSEGHPPTARVLVFQDEISLSQIDSGLRSSPRARCRDASLPQLTRQMIPHASAV